MLHESIRKAPYDIVIWGFCIHAFLDGFSLFVYYNNTHALRGLGRMTARTQENPVKFNWVLSFDN